MLPGVGVTVNGATRWLGAGPLQFQPSELLKLSLVLFAAQLLAARPSATRTLGGLSKPLLIVVGLACALLMKQPDMGTTMVVCFTIGRAPVRGRHADAPARHDRRQRRHARADLRDRRALPARAPDRVPRPVVGCRRHGLPVGPVDDRDRLGRARSGVGLGESVQKIFYLPEAHTDMILAIIGEELGLVGIVERRRPVRADRLRRVPGGEARARPLLEAARGGHHRADPVPGDAEHVRGDGPGAADRHPAAVDLVRQLEPDRRAWRRWDCC